MCQFKSAIVLMNGDVLHLDESESHEDIIRTYKLKDDGLSEVLSRGWCRVECVPKFLDYYSDLSTWALNVDEDLIPSWFYEIRESVKESMQSLVRRKILSGLINGIGYGSWIILPGSKVTGEIKGKILAGAGVDFTGINKGGYDFRKSHLPNSDFSGLNLEHSSFEGAHLNKAKFKDANLKHCIFSEAYCYESNFSCAEMRGCNLNKANLESANMFKANLSHCHAWRARIFNTEMGEADLSNSTFWECFFQETNLTNAKLDETNLSKSVFSSPDGRFFTVSKFESPESGWEPCEGGSHRFWICEVDVKGTSIYQNRST